MTHVISTINLKGGVGKTTLTVGLAEAFSAEFGKRVLVVDLDPQTNATVMLIGDQKWGALNEKGHTLAQLFEDALNPTSRKFDLEKTLQTNVSGLGAAQSIDLLPSSLDLIDLQDHLVNTPVGKYGAVRPFDILWRATKDLLEEYDLVIIDCPPNLGKITQNGLRISQGYIIPTIPDHLSTYGIPQIVGRVADFSSEVGEEIEAYGIVISKYDSRSTVHNNTIKQLRNSTRLPAVFDTIVPQANQFADAAEHINVSTFKQKWGYRGLAERLTSLCGEIIEKLEG